MNRVTIFSIILLAAAALASCGTEHPCGEQTEARFSSAITRATGTSWDAGDRIGITMVANGTTQVLGYQNVAYTTTGNGTFTADAGNRIYFPMDAQKVGFIAYHPYTTAINGFAYSVNVGDQSSQRAIDLLSVRSYDDSPAGFDRNNPNVALRFRHRLSKLVVVVAGDGDLTGMTVSVNGLPTTASYDISTGVFSGTGNVKAITLPSVTSGARYEGIVIPTTVQAAGAVSLSFVVGDQTLSWSAPAGTLLESGKEHIWTIGISGTSGSPVLIDARIVPWSEGDGGTGDAV